MSKKEKYNEEEDNYECIIDELFYGCVLSLPTANHHCVFAHTHTPSHPSARGRAQAASHSSYWWKGSWGGRRWSTVGGRDERSHTEYVGAQYSGVHLLSEFVIAAIIHDARIPRGKPFFAVASK